MRPHIFLATPCYGGLVTQGYMQSVVRLIQQAGTDGYDITLALLGQDALITRSRNTLLAHFLQSHSTTHILFIDGDISFEATLPGRLLNSDRDVVAATYPLKTQYWDAHAWQRLSDGEPPESAALRYVGELCEGDDALREGALATATYAGTGFLLIKRQVITRMIEAYPETRYATIHAYTDPAGACDAHYALFDCMIDPMARTYLSEDFAFCYRWRAIGGTIWLDTEASLTHTGPSDFRGVPATAFRRT